jgi:hypothetical protein
MVARCTHQRACHGATSVISFMTSCQRPARLIQVKPPRTSVSVSTR